MFLNPSALLCDDKDNSLYFLCAKLKFIEHTGHSKCIACTLVAWFKVHINCVRGNGTAFPKYHTTHLTSASYSKIPGKKPKSRTIAFIAKQKTPFLLHWSNTHSAVSNEITHSYPIKLCSAISFSLCCHFCIITAFCNILF